MQQWGNGRNESAYHLWAAEKVYSNLNLMASHLLKLPPLIIPIKQLVCVLHSTKYAVD